MSLMPYSPNFVVILSLNSTTIHPSNISPEPIGKARNRGRLVGGKKERMQWNSSSIEQLEPPPTPPQGRRAHKAIAQRITISWSPGSLCFSNHWTPGTQPHLSIGILPHSCAEVSPPGNLLYSATLQGWVCTPNPEIANKAGEKHLA